jgi:hypothetical protein
MGCVGAATGAAKVLTQAGKHSAGHHGIVLPRAVHGKHLACHELMLGGLFSLPGQEGRAIEAGLKHLAGPGWLYSMRERGGKRRATSGSESAGQATAVFLRTIRKNTVRAATRPPG